MGALQIPCALRAGLGHTGRQRSAPRPAFARVNPQGLQAEPRLRAGPSSPGGPPIRHPTHFIVTHTTCPGEPHFAPRHFARPCSTSKAPRPSTATFHARNGGKKKKMISVFRVHQMGEGLKCVPLSTRWRKHAPLSVLPTGSRAVHLVRSGIRQIRHQDWAIGPSSGRRRAGDWALLLRPLAPLFVGREQSGTEPAGLPGLRPSA